MQWAEKQWERVTHSERLLLSQHEMRALLLVYRQAWLRLKSDLESLRFGELQTAIDLIEKAAESSPEIVYRNGEWRVRGGGPFNDNEEPL